MPRTIRLLLAYDGTSFRGWAAQRDPAIRTVEGELTEVLASVLGRAPRAVGGGADGCGRARARPGRLLLDVYREPGGRQSATPSTAAWAPRWCAARRGRARRRSTRGSPRRRASTATGSISRRCPTRSRLDSCGTAQASWTSVAMRAAARQPGGRARFHLLLPAPGDGASPPCETFSASRITRTETGIELGFRANAFLHQMVRAITGTLVLVGGNRLSPRDVPRLLAARDRTGTGNLAPAHGLTLERVVYGLRARP